jgi:hypothetical protein
MSLLDELEADSKAKGVGCVVCAFIDSQANADEWDAAFAMPKSRITTMALFRRMKRDGYPGSDGPLRAHRGQHRVPR